MDAQIVVLGFEGQFAAEGMLTDFNKMQEEGIIQLVDAVVTSRGFSDRIDIKQTHSDTGKFALKGSGVGLLAGLLLGGPIGGLAAGAAVGAIAGKMKDAGIDDDFVESTSEWLSKDSSALFLMVQEADSEKVLERLGPIKARVLTTSLDGEQEEILRKRLQEEKY